MAGEERRPGFHAVLQAERKIINRRRKSLNRKELHSDPPPVDAQQCIGLALSGGGIRSSTFSLGVLQGLARKQLLQRFDYLSTVSGGGYVGCYFTSLFIPKTLRQGSPAAVAPESFSAACEAPYQAILGSSATRNAAQAHADVRSAAKPGAPRGRDPGERAADSGEWSGAASLNWLRENGRYLTPGGAGD